MDSTVLFDQIEEARRVLRDLSILHWLEDDLFSWQWWLLLISSISPWYLWVKYFMDRERKHEVLMFGLLIGSFATTFDVIGVDFLLWAYPDKLFPTFPPLLPADLTVIPVAFMIAYQYLNTWKSYLSANIILAALFSYVIEPVFIQLDMFKLINWTHTFSFLGFILLGIMNRWIVLRINKLN